MLTLEEENNLDDEIIDRVCAADALHDPIWAVRGPRFDVRLKVKLEMRHHQGVLCTRINHLVNAGMLRFEESSEKYEVGFATGAPHTYHRVTLLPA